MRNVLAVVVVELCLVSGCDDGRVSEQQALQVLEAVPLAAPGGMDEASVRLGRFLFWDPILSGDRDVACASCHHPDHGYADGLVRSRGVGASGLGPARTGGALIDRNSPTVLNTGLIGLGGDEAPMFWDGRADGLEEQALLPIQSETEMSGTIAPETILDVVTARVAAVPEYRELFGAAYGSESVTPERIASAIADYERSLVALDSPFDRYLAGDTNAMSEQARRGLRRFAEVGCADCHSGPLLSDFQTHSLGIATALPVGGFDEGAGNGEFRTPPLRNVALTAPYMHDGSLGTLQDVLQHYRQVSGGGGGNNGPGPMGGGGNNNQQTVFAVDNDARRLRLNNDDTQDIIAFLNALTAASFDRTIPATVPSGLPPGGTL